VTEAEFENFDERQAERWIARRFRQFAAIGCPPELSLACAVHPDIKVPRETGTAIKLAPFDPAA
jgi:hypothetical protein